MEQNTFEIKYSGRPRRMMVGLGMVYEGALCLSVTWDKDSNETVETWQNGDWNNAIYSQVESLFFNPYNHL